MKHVKVTEFKGRISGDYDDGEFFDTRTLEQQRQAEVRYEEALDLFYREDPPKITKEEYETASSAYFDSKYDSRLYIEKMLPEVARQPQSIDQVSKYGTFRITVEFIPEEEQNEP